MTAIDEVKAKELLVAYIKKHPLCVLSTMDGTSTHGAAVYILPLEDEPHPSVIFFSHADAKKAQNAAKFPKVAITSFDESSASTMQIEGTASRIEDFTKEQACIQLLLNAAHDRLSTWAPVHMLHGGAVHVYMIRVHRLKMSDFSSGETAHIQEFVAA